MTENHHTPVLLSETMKYLVTDKSGVYFDGTLGFGGHSEEILKMLNKDATVIATDVDSNAFEFSRNKFKDEKRIKLYNFNFSQIDLMAKIENVHSFNGVFADLGVSSFQLDNPDSGFTYRANAKLDLRMDKKRKLSAAEVVNTFPEEEIANIIFRFGEEKNSRKIARTICQRREQKKIETTTELGEIISELTSFKYRVKTLSRVFQALRIFVNDELETLKIFLNKAVELLQPGGRIAILTYHSLEDRIVKETFKYETLDCICPKDYPVCKCDKEQRLKIITKKPVTPSENEIERNFRARSAKLRVGERV
jgi:16S rRNA (cytosine1402-N4)-methyltransferase